MPQKLTNDQKERIELWRQLIRDKKLGWPDTVVALLDTTPVKPTSLAAAFDQFSLNSQNQKHHELLCLILADVLFRKRSAGRKKGSRQDARLLAWGLAYEEVRANHRGKRKLTDQEAAKQIKSSGASRGATVTTIRQSLPAARKLVSKIRGYLEPPPQVAPKPTKNTRSGGWLNL
jgi:hypothetical protein